MSFKFNRCTKGHCTNAVVNQNDKTKKKQPTNDISHGLPKHTFIHTRDIASHFRYQCKKHPFQIKCLKKENDVDGKAMTWLYTQVVNRQSLYTKLFCTDHFKTLGRLFSFSIAQLYLCLNKPHIPWDELYQNGAILTS